MLEYINAVNEHPIEEDAPSYTITRTLHFDIFQKVSQLCGSLYLIDVILLDDIPLKCVHDALIWEDFVNQGECVYTFQVASQESLEDATGYLDEMIKDAIALNCTPVLSSVLFTN